MKKILYFVPAVLAFLFYGVIVFVVDGSLQLAPTVWLALAALLLAGILLAKGKWWGSAFGIAVGFVLIAMGMRETGQIIKEWPIGAAFSAYYAVCGLLASRKKK